MLFTKPISGNARFFLPPIQMTAHGGHQQRLVRRPSYCEPIGFDVQVDRSSRVDVRAVPRVHCQRKALRATAQERFGLTRYGLPAPGHEQIDLILGLFKPSAYEGRKCRRAGFVCMVRERQRLQFGIDRDHAAAKSLVCRQNDGCTQHRGIARARDRRAGRAYFRGVVNWALLALGPRPDGRKVIIRPARNGAMVGFVGPSQRLGYARGLVHSQAPGFQVSHHADQRGPDSASALDRPRACQAHPTENCQPQATRHHADHWDADRCGLFGVESSSAAQSLLQPGLELLQTPASPSAAHLFTTGRLIWQAMSASVGLVPSGSGGTLIGRTRAGMEGSNCPAYVFVLMPSNMQLCNIQCTDQ